MPARYPGPIGDEPDADPAVRQAGGMALRDPRTRRVVALLAGLSLVAALAACDSSGSAKSDAGTATTTRPRHRRGSTTTSSSTNATIGPSDTTGTSDPTPASTNPPPATADCGVQLTRISAAITDGGLQAVPLGSYTIGDCRLAPSQPIWSAVSLTPKPGQTVPHLTVVVERIGSIWTVHSYGAGATGCDAPAPVPAELALGC
jgi:hypothetical protein